MEQQRIQRCRQSAFISALIKPCSPSDLKSQLAETSEAVGKFHRRAFHPADAVKTEGDDLKHPADVGGKHSCPGSLPILSYAAEKVGTLCKM